MKKVRSVLSIILVIAFGCGLFLTGSLAEDAKTVLVGYPTDREWLMTCAPDGSAREGYGYEYLQTVAKHTGWTYEYVYGEWDALVSMLENSKLDILAGVPDSQENVKFPSYAMGTSIYRVFATSDRTDLRNTDITELNGKTIGVASSEFDFFMSWLEENTLNCKVSTYPSQAALSQAMLDGKVSLGLLLEESADNSMIPLAEVRTNQFYVAVSKKNSALVNELNKALAEVYTNNPYYNEELYYKYRTQSTIEQTLTTDEANWVAKHNVINCGYIVDDVFMFDHSENGKHNSAFKELMTQILAKLNLTDKVTIEYSKYETTDELEQALAHNLIDVAFPLYADASSAEDHGYTPVQELTNLPMCIVTKGALPEEVSSIVVPYDVFMEAYAIRQYPNAQILKVENAKGCLAAVAKGSAVATTLPLAFVEQNISSPKYLGLKYTRLQEGCGICMGIKKGESALWKLLNHGLKLVGDEKISEIFTKFEVSESSFNIPKLLSKYGWIGLILLGVLASVIVALVVSRKGNIQLAEAGMEIEDARVAAEQASLDKSTFLYKMTHDILTPVNAIVEYAEGALRTPNDKAGIRESLTKIRAAGKHTQGLINDSMTLARLDNGKIELDEDFVNLRNNTEDIAAIVKPLAEKKGIEFTTRFKELEDENVFCDELHLTQIMVNFLNNSIKYTKPGGKVRYTVSQTDSSDGFGSYKFVIQDTGVGMGQDEIAHLFDMYQAENSAATNMRASGLGMPIAKKLIDLMGGIVDIKSEPGVGTTIVCVLNFRDAGDDPEEAPIKGLDLKGKRILVVDDELISREALREALEDSGVEVEEVNDGTDAVDIVSKVAPDYYDAVLMDIMMPGMNGYKATQTIRALKNNDYSKLPIVALTANAFEEDRQKSLEVGMNAHLTKPVEMEVLLDTLAVAMAKARR